jgi:hypothetical protein
LQVPPGGWAEAEVEFSTAMLDGPIERKFVVVTDAAEPRHKALPFVLRANVIRPIKLVPEELDFGDLRPGESAERTLLVKLNQPALAEGFRAAACEGEHLQAQVARREGEAVKISVRMTAPQVAGSLGGRVRLEFSGDVNEPASVPVRARVQGALRTTPARLLIEPGKSVRQEQRMRIESLSGEAFSVLGVACPAGIEATLVDTDGSGHGAAERQFVLLRAASADRIPRDATIRIRTDHPQQPELLVAVQVIGQGDGAGRR